MGTYCSSHLLLIFNKFFFALNLKLEGVCKKYFMFDCSVDIFNAQTVVCVVTATGCGVCPCNDNSSFLPCLEALCYHRNELDQGGGIQKQIWVLFAYLMFVSFARYF